MSDKGFLYTISLVENVPVRFSDLAHLIAEAMHPSESKPMAYAAARINLEEELPRAVQSGELIVRNSSSLSVHTFPYGDALQRAVIFPWELRTFLENRGIGLHLMPHGSGPIYWTISNAASAIAEQEMWHDGAKASLLKSMGGAAAKGELIFRDPHTDLIKTPGAVLDSYECVTVADVNDWLNKQGASYRWNAVEEKQTSGFKARQHVSVEKTNDAQFVDAQTAGVKRREQQIRLIEKEAKLLGFDVKNIPEGGKSQLLRICKEKHPKLFGVSNHPFEGAWKEARKQDRVRTAKHNQYTK